MLYILGGGMVGQLAGHLLRGTTVLERGGPLKYTGTWGATYLWERLPGIRCRKFKVLTEIDGMPPEKDRILAYKAKVNKASESQDQWGLQFQNWSTGYEIDESLQPLMQHNTTVKQILLSEKKMLLSVEGSDRLVPYDQLINTLPLRDVLVMCGLMQQQEAYDLFPAQSIHVRFAKCTPDCPHRRETCVYVNYLSSPATPWYRFCCRDGGHHLETLDGSTPYCNIEVAPGKISPSLSTEQALHTLRTHGIYCFGRFARWESNELVHDTWRDLRAHKEDACL